MSLETRSGPARGAIGRWRRLVLVLNPIAVLLALLAYGFRTNPREIPSPLLGRLEVHNLEDGGVLVQYNCPAGCPELVQQLKTVVGRYDTRVVLAPHQGMRARIALTAWTRIDTLDEFDEKRITRFIDAYRGVDHHARS